jgi:beta-glucosidase
MRPELERSLADLTLEEKVRLLSGADTWRTTAIERLAIGALKTSDGPVGVRGDATVSAACFPAPIAVAATFDTGLAHEIGRAIDDELVSKGAQLLLAPTVNIARHPLGGRNFESFGEDPVLTSAMGVAVIAGVQHTGRRGACVKHFAANDVEYRRLTVSVEVDERSLREVYLAPFEAAVRAGVWAVMAAYPKVGGVHATEHAHLLQTILRDEWGFDGVVLSDWGATHGPEAVVAGLDLEMPGPPLGFGPRLLEAVRHGRIDEALVDRRVRALLGLLERAGRLEGSELPVEEAIDRPEHRALIRRVGAAGTVLVRNDGILPLVAARLTRVAVIGPNAHPGRIQGGGSAQVPAHRTVSPLDGLRDRLGDVEVTWSPGCLTHRYLPFVPQERWVGPDGVDRPVLAETFASADLSGVPVVRRTTTGIGAFHHGPQTDLPDPLSWSRRWTARYQADRSGPHEFGVTAVGPARVIVDGVLVVDNWTAPERGESFFAKGSVERSGVVDLEAGQIAEVVVEWSRAPDPDLAGLRFGMLAPVDEERLLADARDAAAAADVAVVVVGLDAEWETEGVDRASWDLPGRQAELVARVLEANPRTVVVVNAGGVVDLPWLDQAPATLIVWYPGQEFGHSLAEVLLGDRDPGGRLPVTFPTRLQDSPTWLDVPGDGDHLHYREGVFVGYRWYDARELEPRVPFGHGLSYADLRLGPPSLVEDDGDRVVVQVPVHNHADRSGRAVVQVYLEPPPGPWARPRRLLAAFAALDVGPRDEAVAEVVVPRRRFEVWDPTGGVWVLPGGTYRLRVGASSRDLGEAVAVVR